MSNYARADISEKSKYAISKHRYYELKHYCLQYSEWIKELHTIKTLPNIVFSEVAKTDISDPTVRFAMRRQELEYKIHKLQIVAEDADKELAAYILTGVTMDIGYLTLKERFDIPCCKDTYYDRYRKFFYLLHHYDELYGRS